MQDIENSGNNNIRALFSEHSCIFNPTETGEGTLIEPFVVIGHPTQDKISDVQLNRSRDWNNLEELYEACPKCKTLIGKNCIIRSGTVIYSGTVIGDYADIAHNCIIREETKIGPYCRLLPGTSVRKAAVIGQGARIAGVVGDRSYIHPYVTSMGFLVHDYQVGVSGKIEAAPILKTGSIIGRGAVVVGGITIGKFAIVGAGAIVRKDVEEYAIVAGNPARTIGKRKKEDIDRIKIRMEKEGYL